MKHNQRFSDIANDAKTHVQQIDVTQVYNLLNSNTPFKLIDVREADEWQVGHLPKAIHISKGVIERDIESKVPDINEKIIVYCGGGSRSALAAENLIRMGYQNVLSMEGGFRGWKAANYPVEE